jgi:predicted RNase H-like HicB family nuclease
MARPRCFFDLVTRQRTELRDFRFVVDFRQAMDRQIKVVVEKRPDGYVSYPLGLKGIVVGEGDSYEEALADLVSAIRFHIETFGADVWPDDAPPIEAFIAEATIPA